LDIAKVLLRIINNYVQVTLKSIIFFLSSGRGTSVPKYDRLYLTRYPAGFRSYGDAVEEKYGKLSRVTDRFLVDVISNNVIQTVSCIAAFHLGRFARSRPNSYVFLDSKFDFFDIFQAFVSVIDFMRRLFRVIIALENEKSNIAFLSRLVCGDLKRGAIALPGNLYFALKISRLYSLSNVKQLVLYMHEYGYGRIATHISRSVGVFVVGYQHGPFSPSRLIYYGGSMAVETSLAPLVLAESQAARVAYMSSGHRRVLVLTNGLPRLRYLSKIRRSGGRGTYIVLGLHDGQHDLDKLIELSHSMGVPPPLVKLHPRSGFRPRPSSEGEYHIAECDVTTLLGGADLVLGTYSSVLEEAKYLGIKTICYSRDGYISELIQ